MSNEEKSVIAKVRKLLKLAGDKGATQAEKERAAEFAAALMLRHGIESRDIEDTVVVFGEYTKRRYRPWERILAQAAGTMFGVRVMKNGQGKVSFVGRKDNINAAEVLRDFLIEQARALMLEERRNYTPGLYVRTNDWERLFLNGVAIKAAERCLKYIEELKRSDQGAQAAAGCTALVVASHIDQLNSEVEQKLHGYSTLRARGLSVSRAGLDAGDRVNIHRYQRVEG